MPSPDPAVQGLTVAIAQNEGYGVAGKASKYNNPGDIKAPWTGFPADSAGITKFPTIEAGEAALNHQASLILNGSPNYNPQMTIAQAAAKYTDNDPNAASNWSKTLDPSGKLVTPDTTLAQYNQLVASGKLTPPQNLPNPAANNGPNNTSPGNNASAPQDKQQQDEMDLPDRNASAVTYSPLDNPFEQGQIIQQLDTDLVINKNLDETPWYKDGGMVTGNPRIRGFVAPISFRMLINGNPLNTKGLDPTGKPIEVQLNASVKSYSKTMRHVYTKNPTRTGIHITFWGQQADLIEAQCTTGVFMNQMGLTDFMSTAKFSTDLINLLNQGFAHTINNSTGNVDTALKITQQRTTNPSGLSAFRVAAQDAFVELLSLFKSNGNVWFRKDNYTGAFSQSDQAGIATWSPTAGTSTQQGNARNNDVMTRGSIAMQLKNSTYLGFFKSLSWTQDASNPFQWNFNFVFQVERTIELLEYPVGG